MKWLRRTCKEAAALMIAREDRALGTADRLALRLHLLVCDACPRFERQILTMRNTLHQWRNYTTSDENN
jgi:Putative zinc-finger